MPPGKGITSDDIYGDSNLENVSDINPDENDDPSMEPSPTPKRRGRPPKRPLPVEESSSSETSDGGLNDSTSNNNEPSKSSNNDTSEVVSDISSLTNGKSGSHSRTQRAHIGTAYVTGDYHINSTYVTRDCHINSKSLTLEG